MKVDWLKLYCAVSIVAFSFALFVAFVWMLIIFPYGAFFHLARVYWPILFAAVCLVCTITGVYQALDKGRVETYTS